ncbi:hypothetical protein LINPERPRIM_LOCUS41182 [Linum perenne]
MELHLEHKLYPEKLEIHA